MTNDNIMNNIAGIEMGQLVLDGSTPSNCIMIQTQRNKYCFRLSETFPIEKQYEMFRQFVIDVNTPIQTESEKEDIKEKTDEYDIKTYYDDKLDDFLSDYFYNNAELQSEIDYDCLQNNSKEIYNKWKELTDEGEGEWLAAEKAYNLVCNKGVKEEEAEQKFNSERDKGE